jgi:hypothetical protein
MVSELLKICFNFIKPITCRDYLASDYGDDKIIIV